MSYSEAVVEKDIQNLYKTGAILNVRIFGQGVADGVKVTVALQTRAVVREIEIDGAQQIKAKRLRKAIPIKINDPVNEEQLEKGRQAVVDVYKGRGFNDVNVQFKVETIEERKGTARVVYTVDEGGKAATRPTRSEGKEHFSGAGC